MTEKERKEIFVRDHLSPLIAAAKDNKYASWSAAYMSGREANEIYKPHDPLFDDIEVVVCTVEDDNGGLYCYYINVSCDSLIALAYDVLKVVMYK